MSRWIQNHRKRPLLKLLVRDQGGLASSTVAFDRVNYLKKSLDKNWWHNRRTDQPTDQPTYTYVDFTFYLSRYTKCFVELEPFYPSGVNTLFMVVLIISFLLVIFVLGYSLITLNPSKSCGPFRNNEKTIIQTIGDKVMIDGHDCWFCWQIHEFNSF